MKRYIYSMATSRSELGDYFESHTRVIMENLIKLYLYPYDESVMHWRREIANQLNCTDKLKGSHKLPSAKFIFKNTYEEHSRYIPRYIECVIEKYGEPRSLSHSSTSDSFSGVEELLIRSIRNYFLWISAELSDQPQLTYSSIYKYLEEHGF